jgi:ElaA protein
MVSSVGSALVLSLHDQPLGSVPAASLYRILQLRSQVFVVEQDCVFLDADGRDLDPACRLLWLEDDTTGEVPATARVIDEGAARHIGRIVTAEAARGQGLAARLLEHALATAPGPWVMHAQARLADWYATFGFAISGPEYLDDGIPHVPMRKEL